MATLDSVCSAVAKRVTPDQTERERLADAAATLIDRAEAALAEHGVDGDVLQVGSTARGTWLAGDRDIDIFVRFPPTVDREQLETVGLEVGHSVLPDGHEEYAEHPYVTGEYDGFAVDLVPCYDVESATEIRSAVDRTPFHTSYIEQQLTEELCRDIRIFKQFLTGIGAYGSDLRTEGFSGYLAELLVVSYDGFEPLLAAATDWHPPVALDPENHGAKTFDDPLTVIDPTDPERNVAAVLSASNLARLQHAARELVADPRRELFFKTEPEPLDGEELRNHLERRDTTPVAMVFETPSIVADQLYPQLRKSQAGVAAGLESHDFSVFRAASFADDTQCVLLFELSETTQPAVERHEGPPVAVRDHATEFFETYDGDDTVYGPFIVDDRYVVERPRAVTDARVYLNSDAVFEVALGVQIESALKSGYELLWDTEITALADRFGTELATYFEPEP